MKNDSSKTPEMALPWTWKTLHRRTYTTHPGLSTHWMILTPNVRATKRRSRVQVILDPVARPSIKCPLSNEKVPMFCHARFKSCLCLINLGITFTHVLRPSHMTQDALTHPHQCTCWSVFAGKKVSNTWIDIYYILWRIQSCFWHGNIPVQHVQGFILYRLYDLHGVLGKVICGSDVVQFGFHVFNDKVKKHKQTWTKNWKI